MDPAARRVAMKPGHDGSYLWCLHGLRSAKFIFADVEGCSLLPTPDNLDPDDLHVAWVHAHLPGSPPPFGHLRFFSVLVLPGVSYRPDYEMHSATPSTASTLVPCCFRVLRSSCDLLVGLRFRCPSFNLRRLHRSMYLLLIMHLRARLFLWIPCLHPLYPAR